MKIDTEPVWDIERDAEGLPVRLWWRGVIPGSWREQAAVVVNRVIREAHSTDLHLLKQLLRDAYPFGERRYYPYKVWLSEVNRQLGLTQPPQHKPSPRDPVPPEQGRLF